MLERLNAGAEPVIADNGLKALEVLRNNRDRFDLILMDIQMPEMDGLETTQRIRQMEKQGFLLRRHKIVALSAVTLLDSGEKKSENGGSRKESQLPEGLDGYLTKPMKLADLTSLLKSVSNEQ
jgi:CheY-like chemotaxis protein